jgi:pimeloyl-ACP methyl ester carboxylesterase
MNRANFLPLAHRLGSAGLGPVLGFEYWTRGKVSSAARKLSAYIDTVRNATGCERVDLIGHSLCGVVGRYLVQLGGGAHEVRCLVTLGASHGGADFSVFGLGRPVKELKRDSELLSRLNATPLPAGTAVTTIWSHADALVPWEGSARLHGGEEIIFDDLGHLSLIASRRVADIVIERLRR